MQYRILSVDTSVLSHISDRSDALSEASMSQVAQPMHAPESSSAS